MRYHRGLGYRFSLLLFVTAALFPKGAIQGEQKERAPAEPANHHSREPELRVGSLNVHYVSRDQKRLAWERRKDSVAAAIRAGNPDIMAFQEMETFAGGHFNRRNLQLTFLREAFPEYRFAAVGDPRNYPFTQPVMYRAERFEVLEQGFFFFSPTPDRIYADPWDGRFPAFCSWVRFWDKRRGERIYLYNLHFDHQSLENRLRGAQLVAERVANRDHPEDEVIVVGDFNAPRFFRPVRIIEELGLEVAKTTGSTVHFYRGIDLVPARDHLLFSSGYDHVETRVLRRRFDGVWPSDHYPFLVTLK